MILTGKLMKAEISFLVSVLWVYGSGLSIYSDPDLRCREDIDISFQIVLLRNSLVDTNAPPYQAFSNSKGSL